MTCKYTITLCLKWSPTQKIDFDNLNLYTDIMHLLPHARLSTIDFYVVWPVIDDVAIIYIDRKTQTINDWQNGV